MRIFQTLVKFVGYYLTSSVSRTSFELTGLQDYSLY
ncbi:uncharacterized protein METZ01_LOCUS53605 [marine metagenome]|uniref:Uncharacterized protein n=1 Tax=marine metagenome TaxID=408172 RepID=A0A381SBR9_9ZZZZ